MAILFAVIEISQDNGENHVDIYGKMRMMNGFADLLMSKAVISSDGKIDNSNDKVMSLLVLLFLLLLLSLLFCYYYY